MRSRLVCGHPGGSVAESGNHQPRLITPYAEVAAVMVQVVIITNNLLLGDWRKDAELLDVA
jgi:hypothetical protein